MKQSGAHNNGRILTRRSFLLGAGQMAMVGILGGRLTWLQVTQGEKYKTLSDQNRINTSLTPPMRGEIVDRYGVPLASNAKNYTLVGVPEEMDTIQISLDRASNFVSISPSERERAEKQAKKSARYNRVEIKSGLDWNDVAKVEANLIDLPGIHVEQNTTRIYPLGLSCAHITGYVGAVSEKNLTAERDAPVLKLPGMRIGKTGIERVLEQKLRGQAGTIQSEVNVIGRPVRVIDTQSSFEGRRIHLTLDSGHQQFLHERLSHEKSASAVVMDAHTGAVYAMSSHPAYNPVDFVNGISHARYNELLTMTGNALTNKAVAGQYPAASTFKMVVMLAALKHGVVNAKTSVHCKGYYEYGKERFHCWSKWGHGWVDGVESLMKSCDIYYYELATKIGIDKIAEMARVFGLGQTYDFPLPQEKPGLIPDKSWMLATKGKQWRPGETIVSSIGQGYVLATPLQLATMTARLVNGGFAVNPHLIRAVDDQKIQYAQQAKINVSDSHLAYVKRGMDAVVNHEKGTARASKIDDETMAMGGKTGTAQVQRITKADRAAGIKNEDLEWRKRHHALFVGYAPINNPRYVCSIVVEHGIGGSTTAAPIAHDLLIDIQNRRTGMETI